jgi:hypothetical protein
MGRLVRDRALLDPLRERSRPITGERVTYADHPAVWRAAIVALGLGGTLPPADDVEAGMVDTCSLAAVNLPRFGGASISV